MAGFLNFVSISFLNFELGKMIKLTNGVSWGLNQITYENCLAHHLGYSNRLINISSDRKLLFQQ